MSIDDKISKAKAKLLVEYPYFGTVASKLKLVANEDIEAFTSDGIALEYSPNFVKNASIAELEFVFANGAMHASLAYENRQNNRAPWLWQLATDYAINDMLVQNGLDRPYQAHFSERFGGMYTEEIYADLKADILMDAEEIDDTHKKENSNQTNQTKETEPKESQIEDSLEERLQEQLFASFAQSRLEKELQSGGVPQSIDRFFKIEKFSKVDWREQLRDALDRFIKDDYVQMPPHKKFLSQGIYLPSVTSETFELVIAIDSSGSVDEKLLAEFFSEINALMLGISKYKIDILVCDDKVRLHKQFLSGEFLDIELVGGGATDFRPIFEFIEQELHDTKMLLYFTDLQGHFPKEIPSFDVKWISPKLADIPFGEIIQI